MKTDWCAYMQNLILGSSKQWVGLWVSLVPFWMSAGQGSVKSLYRKGQCDAEPDISFLDPGG